MDANVKVVDVTFVHGLLGSRVCGREVGFGAQLRAESESGERMGVGD